MSSLCARVRATLRGLTLIGRPLSSSTGNLPSRRVCGFHAAVAIQVQSSPFNTLNNMKKACERSVMNVLKNKMLKRLHQPEPFKSYVILPVIMQSCQHGTHMVAVVCHCRTLRRPDGLRRAKWTSLRRPVVVP